MHPLRSSQGDLSDFYKIPLSHYLYNRLIPFDPPSSILICHTYPPPSYQRLQTWLSQQPIPNLLLPQTAQNGAATQRPKQGIAPNERPTSSRCISPSKVIRCPSTHRGLFFHGCSICMHTTYASIARADRDKTPDRARALARTSRGSAATNSAHPPARTREFKAHARKR
jgi:hypothetical protein